MIHNLQDIQDKIFFESKNILETLGKIASKEDLLNKHDLIEELSDRVAFLKILNKNKEFFILENESEIIDNQFINEKKENGEDLPSNSFLESDLLDEDIIEEEVIFTNEINESGNSSTYDQDISQNLDLKENIQETEELEHTSAEENNKEFFEIDNESKISEEVIINEEKILPTYEERVVQKEREFLEMEERRRKIVEFSKHEQAQAPKVALTDIKPIQPHSIDKKFKLSSIKGIKAVKNLFDEDPLEKVEEEETEHQETEVGSILKTNIATDFMEASKKRPEFRIDFNDKIAFTKLLFGGDELELKKTVDELNSYDNLEDAKQFLSGIYYRKDWSKVDEYAQRLWNLVENKFL